MRRRGERWDDLAGESGGPSEVGAGRETYGHYVGFGTWRASPLNRAKGKNDRACTSLKNAGDMTPLQGLKMNTLL